MLRSVWLKMLHDQWRMLAIWTVLTGLLTSRGITNHPPLEVLRQET